MLKIATSPSCKPLAASIFDILKVTLQIRQIIVSHFATILDIYNGTLGNMKNIFILSFSIFFSITSCGQTKTNKQVFGLEHAKQELKKCLLDKNSKQLLVDTLISNGSTAIKVAESILFGIYGEDNIVRQRPYETYLIKNYWVITGTLPKGWAGGTFLIIINSINGQVIKLTHGK